MEDDQLSKAWSGISVRPPSLHLLVTCFMAADQTLPVFPLTCCQTTK